MSNTATRKILIVEDESYYYEKYCSGLASKAEVLVATTVAEAKALFTNTEDISVIVMDACLEDPNNFIDVGPNTFDLVRFIRQSFRGPMIAASSSEEYRKDLIKAGCDYEAKKEDVVDKVSELLF